MREVEEVASDGVPDSITKMRNEIRTYVRSTPKAQEVLRILDSLEGAIAYTELLKRTGGDAQEFKRLIDNLSGHALVNRQLVPRRGGDDRSYASFLSITPSGKAIVSELGWALNFTL